MKSFINMQKTTWIAICIAFASIFYSIPIQSQTANWTTLTPTNPPPARFGHSMTTLPDGRVIVFGGENDAQDLCNSLFAYDYSVEWENLNPTGTLPQARKSHCAWHSNGKMYIHGGIKANAQAGDDLWAYDPATNQWEEKYIAGNKPSARYGHKASYNSSDGYVYISGGNNGTNDLDDVWRFDPITETYNQLTTIPVPMSDHISEIIDNKLYLSGEFGVMRIYDILAGTWTYNSEGPYITKGGSSTVATNTNGQKTIFIFGGYVDTYDWQESDKVWTYNTVLAQLGAFMNFMPFVWAMGACAAQITDGKTEYMYQKILFFGGLSDSIPIDSTVLFETGTPTGIADIESQALLCNIYPNPCDQFAEIYVMANETGVAKIEIFLTSYN